jgi:hypothetical protein
LQAIIPRAQGEEVLAQTGQEGAVCKRLPGWFMGWFMIALGLCGRDSYRQIFRIFSKSHGNEASVTG